MIVYAEDLENMVYECIAEKLSGLNETRYHSHKSSSGELNDLKLKVKAVEQTEKQLMDTIPTGGFHGLFWPSPTKKLPSSSRTVLHSISVWKNSEVWRLKQGLSSTWQSLGKPPSASEKRRLL